MLIGRREWIGSGLRAGAGGVLLGAGASRLLAAVEPDLGDALRARAAEVLGQSPQPTTDNASLEWEIPEKAEWGARVPLLVSAAENAEALAVFVDRSEEPLAFVFRPGKGAHRTVAAPIRVCRTGVVAAVARYADRAVSRAATVYVPASAACAPAGPPSAEIPTEGSISTKVRYRRGAVRLEVRLSHPMSPEQHIRSLRVLRRDETILELLPTPTLSSDPALTFRFDSRRGEYLKVTWEDTRGLAASHDLRVR